MATLNPGLGSSIDVDTPDMDVLPDGVDFGFSSSPLMAAVLALVASSIVSPLVGVPLGVIYYARGAM
jgi:hypothetical protein